MDNLVEKVLCLEVLEKISRLQRFLNLEPDSLRQQGTEVVDIFTETINCVLDNLYPLLHRLRNDAKLDVWEQLAVTRRLSSTMSSVDVLHAQLQLIHSSWLQPVTHIFVRDILDFVPLERRHKNVSVVLSNSYSFEESDLASYFEYMLRSNIEVAAQGETPTIFLPKIERDNPLNWAILIHECGHADYAGVAEHFSIDTVIPTDVDDSVKNMLNNWAEEIYCDLFAIKILGPAYLASFITFTFALSWAGGSEIESVTHPADIVRICIMLEALEKSKLKIVLPNSELEYPDIASFFYNILEERTKLERRHTRLAIKPLKAPVALQDFVDVISERIDDQMELGKKLVSEDLSRINYLAERLARGIPIGSFHDPILVDSAKKAFEDLRPDEIISRFDEFKKAVKEPRAMLWEILNAGWLHKVSVIYPKGFSLFFGSNNMNLHEKIMIWNSELEVVDKLLLKSIESSQIQKIME